MTQCTQTILGAFGSGASGSSIIRTRLLAPLGTPSHASGGETSSPSQVYFEGMGPFCWNAGEIRVIAMAAFPHRIISAVAKRITASLEFRCGDTGFIASIVAKPTDRSISSAHNAVAALSYAPIHRWYQMLWGRAELILRQPESSDGAAPCNRSTPLILPSTWLLSSVHQPGSSPPASL